MFINFLSQDPSPSRYEPKNMTEAMTFARAIVDSGITPHIKTPEAAFIVLATGAELGLSAMQSLRCIYIIDNRPSLSADLVVGLVKRSPVCRWFRLVESTTESATYETLRRNEPQPTRYTYSLDDARRSGLLNKMPWRLYPSAMLRARAASTLARMVYPDLVSGLIDDELNALPDLQSAQTSEPDTYEPDALQGELLVAHDPSARSRTAKRPARKARRASAPPMPSPSTTDRLLNNLPENHSDRLLKQARQARALELKGMNTREAARHVAERLLHRNLFSDLPAAMQGLARHVSASIPLPDASPEHILSAWLELDSPITPASPSRTIDEAAVAA